MMFEVPVEAGGTERLCRSALITPFIAVPFSSAAKGISRLDPHAFVGVATQLSSNGRLKSLALATRDSVVLIWVDSTTQFNSSCHRTELQDLLRDGRVLVGFGMAQIALQIHRDIRAHVGNGVDLGTLCSPSTGEPWAPSKLVATRLCAAAPLSQIDRLWYGEEDSSRQVALRAWISVMYVSAFFLRLL
jgi:hypothetical protein